MGIKTNPNDTFSLTEAHSEFLPPKSWKRTLIPYKARIVGGSTFVCGLHRPGLVAGLTLTKGGLMNVDIYNSTEEVVYLPPKTVLANILGADVFIQEFGKKARRLFPESRSYKKTFYASRDPSLDLIDDGPNGGEEKEKERNENEKRKKIV